MNLNDEKNADILLDLAEHAVKFIAACWQIGQNGNNPARKSHAEGIRKNLKAAILKVAAEEDKGNG